MKNILIPLLVIVLLTAACKNKNQSAGNNEYVDSANTELLKSPDFNADSAFSYVKKQVDFGPRIPGSAAHAQCAAWLEAKLKHFGAEVIIQSAPVKTYDGKTYTLKNIIASFAPAEKERVLVSAHWDTRPFSDKDADHGNRDKPFEGANDGGSGVGVILEMARQLQQQQPGIGVDFILWDLEDYGQAADETEDEKTWCLGSQYWAANPHVAGYKAKYGINLDMVGGINAQFLREEHSRNFAPDILKMVWDTAKEIGYSSYFIYRDCSEIVDDHFWMNKAGVPTVNIIHYSDEAGFYINWHTQEDNVQNISKQSLKATGQTILEVLFREGKR
jgi:glutaminyl-peptide cyclotransferase